MEGQHCFNPSSNCADAGVTLPLLEYSHAGGACSISGGYRYRGTQIPSLNGAYLYGDYCSGTIWKATQIGTNWISKHALHDDAQHQLLRRRRLRRAVRDGCREGDRVQDRAARRRPPESSAMNAIAVLLCAVVTIPTIPDVIARFRPGSPVVGCNTRGV